ncbi:helix-turn-helix transcriptional regulator [Streptomyces xanthii]|uniref:AAA family ATPase n=1 Tax=Streptomyces xanthii TaxID=2768069 RepID=A0A7H1BC83_9ACTN|nr:LuxR family transcriptional regulator [Streptomyces xanthii]QNS06338.1 AAA family ATPase [Streptomyces xanthii]
MPRKRELYGRRREQALLHALVADAEAGPVLMLRGDVGTGKTALLDDVAAHTLEHRPGTTVLRCAGGAPDAALPFSGLLDLLTPVLDHTDALPDFQRRALTEALGLCPPTGQTGELTVRTALRTLLAALPAPVLLVADDLPDLDPATRAALLFLARRPVPGTAVLLAARTSPEHDLPTLDLAGIDDDAARALLDARGVRGAHTAALIAAAEGNPLALTELPEPGPAPLPARLRSAFADRVRALPPQTRTLLLVAAAESRGATASVLAAARHLKLPATALATAETGGLLDVTGPALRFRHPLLRSVLYAGAPSADRARVHEALAAALTGHEALWHRALAATEPDEDLAAALERDADAIAGRGGLTAATTVLTRAAELSPDPAHGSRRFASAAHAAWKSGHPETARTLTARPDRDSPELARLEGLIAYSSGDQPGALRQLVRAAEAHAEHAPAAAAALLFMACDAAEHAGLDEELRRTALRITTLDLPPRHHAYGRLLATGPGAHHDPWAVLDAAPDELGSSRVHRWLWPLAITRDAPDPAPVRDFAERACAEIAAEGVQALLPRPLLWLADLECRTGRIAAATAHAQEALRCTRDLDQPVARADALALLARIAALHADPACRGFADEATALALPLRNRAAQAEASWARALLALARNDTAEAVEHLLTVRSTHSRIARLSAPDLALAQGAVLEAGTDGCAADPFARARAALARGEQLRRDRRAAAAREHLRDAAALFEGLGLTVWRDRARAELRAAGGTAPTPVPHLTPQEHEVARLAAQGLSNKEIGARLTMSPRTAGYHLYKVFPKLGITSRAQLRDLNL